MPHCGEMCSLATPVTAYLASVSCGDIRLMTALVENAHANAYVRVAALRGLITLVACGEQARDDIVAYLQRLFQLVFRTLYRGFCLLRTEYGFCGLPAPRSGLRDGCNGHGFAPSGSEPC